jgi:protease I
LLRDHQKETELTDQPLIGKNIAILVANGFEETEMTEPQRALLKLGATVRVISPEQGLVNGWLGAAWGHYFPTDKHVGDVLGADFDLLVLPGGERSVAKLMGSAHTKRIVGHFLDAGKGIAAIDDGVRLLAQSQKIKGRQVTGPATVEAEVTAEGGKLVDEAIVVDKSLVTARGLADLDAFVAELSRVFIAIAEQRRAAA